MCMRDDKVQAKLSVTLNLILHAAYHSVDRIERSLGCSCMEEMV